MSEKFSSGTKNPKQTNKKILMDVSKIMLKYNQSSEVLKAGFNDYCIFPRFDSIAGKCCISDKMFINIRQVLGK